MRKVRERNTGPVSLAFNATPMVDVIFMLTIFFMLVSRFSSAEQIPMQLPKPAESKARVEKMRERVIVNCRLQDPNDPQHGGVLYSIGPNRPEPLDVLADRFAALKRESPGIKVVVRADRRLPYGPVREVMRVIAGSGIEVLNVVAHVAEVE